MKGKPMIPRRDLLPIILGIALWGCVGCRGGGQQAATTGGPSTGAPGTGRSLQIKGSDTMVNLSQAWAEAFMKAHAGSSISVTGGGTGTGIAAFLNATTDPVNASRPMREAEISQAKAKGLEPVQHEVAVDGLAIAVHQRNPIKGLTKQQLADVYTGKINDWSQVGGKPGKIVALSRESSSGTYVFFREHVMDDQPYRPDALLLPSTRAIEQELSDNANGIGYGGEAYFKGKPNIKLLPISAAPGKPAVYPSNENVISGQYPVARKLYVYSRGTPTGLAAEFIEFCRSPEGQKIVEQIGYVPLPSTTTAGK
jgi:phosphate transport system substrate-binding protein